MTRNRTELALIARGIDSALAMQLRKQGWTLQKLQMQTAQQLADLGIGAEIIAEMFGEGRPPIPNDVLARLLFDNRWLCCVCRTPQRPIVVHHIEHWSISRDHSPANLAVLCTIDHGEAHTDRGLELSLTPARIRTLKEIWEKEVQQTDRLAIQQSTQYSERHWWYFNHLRLFALAEGAGIDLKQLVGFERAKRVGLCDEEGLLVTGSGPMYTGGTGAILMRLMVSVLNAVLEHGTVRNISDDLDRGTISSLLIEDDVVYVQGLYRFAELADADGAGDCIQGTRSVNGITITFVFDRNEGTSASARSLWLRGAHSLGAVMQIRKIKRVPKGLEIMATVLAIRSADPELKLRRYEASLNASGLGLDYFEDDDEPPFDEEPSGEDALV